MELIISVIGWIIFGLIVGAIARFFMPGRQQMGWLMTIGLGVLGSFVGGFLGNLLLGSIRPGLAAGGWITSVLGALLVLFIYSRMASAGKA